MTLDGPSSHPATKRPNIIQSAPTASALHIFPLFLFPPSLINGHLYYLQIGATSISAVNYGTPHPLTTLVIQIDPLPIPHLIPSAPALINFNAPSPVATDPATISTPVSSNASFNFSKPLRATLEWPFAISKTRTSTPALASFSALSISSSLAPTAAPTNK